MGGVQMDNLWTDVFISTSCSVNYLPLLTNFLFTKLDAIFSNRF